MYTYVCEGLGFAFAFGLKLGRCSKLMMGRLTYIIGL